MARPKNPVQFGGTSEIWIEIHSAFLFEPGGDVWEWCDDRAGDISYWASVYCPPTRSMARRRRPSTSFLVNSIYYQTYPTGPKMIGFDVGATAPYAIYVHEGTANQGNNYIYTKAGFAQKGVVDKWIKSGRYRDAKSGNWLVLPGFSLLPTTKLEKGTTPFPSWNYVLRVRGQRANPFLSDAYSTVARDHPALPRMRAHKHGMFSKPDLFG